MAKKLTIALAGNPNSGKTTLFNNLTGARQHVGNYPGVTVEKKEGTLRYKDYEINVVDLPGTYSLTAYSMDEIVARNFVVEEKPDMVIDVIDASNLERNLYLTTQFMELGVPLILAFNMYDVALQQGFAIDNDRLSELLGCPIVFTIASKKIGMNELLDEAVKMAEGKPAPGRTAVDYGKEIQEELGRLEELIAKDRELARKYPARWLGIKLLENDQEVIKKVKESLYAEAIQVQAGQSAHRL
ncbi:MAG: FeoB small GTPase domain-containing protein, partial [Kiritimatiellia bacterium]|nr:FeoB small GTPase domain-containing protein [Kiritimatiellia bacterium]